MRPSHLLFAFAPVLLAACQASVEVNNKKAKAADEPEPPPSVEAAEAPRQTTAHIGVLHNLKLSAQAAQTATCRCMAAAVGSGGDSTFEWRGKPPMVGDDALVLAISSEGTPCDRPTGGRGPSIQAVEEDGGNVVVTIEEARGRIPLAQGAVFRRPAGESWLIFRAGRLPYDDVLPGSPDSVCRIRLR